MPLDRLAFTTMAGLAAVGILGGLAVGLAFGEPLGGAFVGYFLAMSVWLPLIWLRWHRALAAWRLAKGYEPAASHPAEQSDQ